MSPTSFQRDADQARDLQPSHLFQGSQGHACSVQAGSALTEARQPGLHHLDLVGDRIRRNPRSRTDQLRGRDSEKSGRQRGSGGGVPDPHLSQDQDGGLGLHLSQHLSPHLEAAMYLLPGEGRLSGKVSGSPANPSVKDSGTEGSIGVHPDVDDNDSGIHAPRQRVDGGPPGSHVAAHLTGDLGRIGTDPAMGDPVVTGHDDDTAREEAGRGVTQENPQAEGQFLQMTQASRGLGEVIEVSLDGRSVFHGCRWVRCGHSSSPGCAPIPWVR